MQVERLSISDIVKIVPARHGDRRGYFSEVFRDQWFRDAIADITFVQENQSFSVARGTVRGLHFQREPFAQGKLVRCLAGAMFDVAVDIRQGSPSYGRWVGAELSAENGAQIWIPAGFAHGFLTLEPNTVMHYKLTAPHSAKDEGGVLWSDPDIGVVWPVKKSEVVLSDKDRVQPRLADLAPAFFFARSLESTG